MIDTVGAGDSPGLQLGFGLIFDDLHDPVGLRRLDAHWREWLRQLDPVLADRYESARAHPAELSQPAEAELLIALGPAVDSFLARLFGIESELAELRAAHSGLDPLWRVKWKFVRRQAVLGVPAEEVAALDVQAARAQLCAELAEGPVTDLVTDAAAGFDELRFARAVLAWQANPVENAKRLALAKVYAAWAATTDAGRHLHRHGVLFRMPQATDPYDLLTDARWQTEGGVSVVRVRTDGLRRRLDVGRDPFDLTDPGPTLAGALDPIHYCLLCHPQGQDSCSRGLRSAGEWRRDAFGEPLAGCPLEVRISEFHTLKKAARPIAALAMIQIEHPMVAATGHRICNDCVKGCIYQQQTPVDVPSAESRTLQDVLGLPWGVEIHALLSRWNPLNLRRPLPAQPSGRRVLVVGAGPAGFTLAHHLLNDGHQVVLVDGLKIEPLPEALWRVDDNGRRGPGRPVRRYADLTEPLSSRPQAGFGGVAEYGITVRWDKNALTLVRLLLERRPGFTLVGGVRFGGTLTLEDAWQLGFDHVALAIGAGRPTVLDVPNGLAPGVRTASDFLMALQLTGAAQTDSLANLQVRLPVVVIGGGLTAIDTATEALAYYAVQVERFLQRHEALVARHGEAAVRADWPIADRDTAETFLAHARVLREERETAGREGRPARLVERLQAWGGVTVAYRRRLVDAPAYRRNPEEVARALEEGIRIAEGVVPLRFDVDGQGAVCGVVIQTMKRDGDGSWHTSEVCTLPARTVFIAAGTRPNTVLAREFPDQFSLRGEWFQPVNEAGQPQPLDTDTVKPESPRVLLRREADGRAVSHFGDVHPQGAGNVVRAMASAKRGWPLISRLLAERPAASDESDAAFAARIEALLTARVVRVERLAPTIVEVVVHAPLAAARFRPGQFYRLQNFLRHAARTVPGTGPATRLAMEGLAMTGAWVDRERGWVSTIVLEMGGSSNLCARLQPGEPVILMGPTGTPTEIVSDQTVILVGGGLGNAVLFSIGAALRQAGSRVLYFAGYRRRIDRFRVADIERAADVVVWCCEESPGFEPGRPQDRAFDGNVVEAMQAWAADERLRAPPGVDPGASSPLSLAQADRLIVIGSDRMMAAVDAARRGALSGAFRPDLKAIGSINSPMQCMLKEVCGQCLQPQIDPESGAVRCVFSCFEQDQPLDRVDFAALAGRLRQNALQERVTAQWLAALLTENSGSRAS